MAVHDLSDEELMERVVRDRDVFSVLVARYEEKLRRYLARLMPGVGDDMDDLLQNVFLKVYVNARGFDTALSFNSWIYRIAHNEAVSWLRRKTARGAVAPLSEDESETFFESARLAAQTGEARLVRDEVARVLGAMNERYRTVLVLRFLEEKTYAEIADILEVPEGTVATLLHRAKVEFTRIHERHNHGT